jgi:HAE1 family hydrophobic/amphiphilic exporter-1
MNLPEFSIHRPVTVLMACSIAILLGLISFVEIPVDLMPETEYPTLTVSTDYEGVAPEEIETLVTRPIEEALASAPGVEEITSTSNEGRSNVRVKFDYGVDLDEAADELRVRLDRSRQRLPEDVNPPMLLKFDVSQFPIMFITVASDGMDPKELRHFAEKNLQYRMERTAGVAQARVSGGLRRQIHVDLDLKKLRALNLSVADVVQRLRRENMNRPVGPVREGRYEVLLRTQGEFENLQDILDVGVATRRGVPVYMRDIATVEDSHEEIRYIVTVNGEPAVRMFIYKQSGANTVDVSDAVWTEVVDSRRLSERHDRCDLGFGRFYPGIDQQCRGGDPGWRRTGGVRIAVFPAQLLEHDDHWHRDSDFGDLDFRADVFQWLYAEHGFVWRPRAWRRDARRQLDRRTREHLSPPGTRQRFD